MNLLWIFNACPRIQFRMKPPPQAPSMQGRCSSMALWEPLLRSHPFKLLIDVISSFCSQRVAKTDRVEWRGWEHYRARYKCLYVVGWDFFLLLWTCSAWPSLGTAQQDLPTIIIGSVFDSIAGSKWVSSIRPLLWSLSFCNIGYR